MDPRAEPGSGLYWTTVADDRTRYLVLDTPDGGTVLISISVVHADAWDAFLAQATPVIESFAFATAP
jgi:hypothetical protein